MPSSRFLALVIAVQAGLVSPLPAQSATSSAAPAITAADVSFMQDMIGHHAQALEMSALVRSRSTQPSLRVLAERITVSQTDEIAMMQQWLRARGLTPAGGAGHDTHMPGMHDMAAMPAMMPGMLTPAQMQALRRARGAAFDRLFLEGMIQHHEGALTMVRSLLAVPGAAQESSINRFVTDVDTDQRAEIQRMRAMLARR